MGKLGPEKNALVFDILNVSKNHLAMSQNFDRKRPTWVWLISAFFVLSCGWTLLSFLLIFLKVVPLNEAQKT